MAPGYSIPPGHKTGLPGPTFGPEIGFAQTLLAKHPKQLIGFIKGTKGGISIEQWSPGTAGDVKSRGECYHKFMDTLEIAKKELAEQGYTMTIRAILWHQGETNAKNTTEEYAGKLTTFITRFREDLGMPEFPVFVGEVIDNEKRDAVRTAQKAVQQTMKKVYFVGVDGLTSHDKGKHFDSKSQLELGQRFAMAWLAASK